MDQPWRIQMFGGLRAECGERAITRFRTQKAGALFAYLAYHIERSHPREVLAELLWPESEPAAGRYNLRLTLYSLRNQFEPPGVTPGAVIKSDRFSIQLNPDCLHTDVADFGFALEAARDAPSDRERMDRLAKAADLYSGELLPGYYQEWILTEQRRLADAYFRAVRDLTACLERAGDWDQAIRHARRAVDADPLREEAHRDLMRVLAAADQPEEALRQFDRMKRVLKEELDVEPSAPTEEVARAIRLRGERQDTSVQIPLPTVPETPGAASTGVPTGTVTFFLAEIQNAAALKQKAGEVYEKALREQERALRRASGAHGGHVLKAGGESCTAAFERPSEALACAIAVHRDLAGQVVSEREGVFRPRMALDTREVKPSGKGPAGSVFRRANGLLLAAHGGQILCSEPTAALLRGNLPSDTWLEDLGYYRLRGVESPERLFSIANPEIECEQFPPPNATQAYTSNLPLQLTRFFGREDELTWLEDILLDDDARLVTLTGPGGSGKTRLSIEAARRLSEEFRGAAWFASLQDLRDPQRIADAVLEALRLQRSSQREPLDQVVEPLSQQPSLLLLDNFEHLVEGGAEWVRELLERVPSLTCLITSRRRLELSGEREYFVAPLPTPRGEMTPEALVQWSSVELFIDRAQAIRPDFQVTPSSARSVADLCHQLEGIPLALELAAARIQVFTPAQMLEQLEHRFEFLVGRKRDVVHRHQTLHAAIEWSYRLLTPELQQFFARLSVFRGGWTAEAAEAVCEEPRAVEFLEQLRQSSLILVEEIDDDPPVMRFRMLDTLREYAAEQLPDNDLPALPRRHAEWFLNLAEEAASHFLKPDQAAWMNRLEREHDNLRAALDWCKSPEGEPQKGLRLAGRLFHFWEDRGYLTEGRARLQDILALEGAREQTPDRAAALNLAGTLAFRQGDSDEAQVSHEECLAIRRELGDRKGEAGSLNNLAMVASNRGNYEAARSLFLEALAVNRELGNHSWEAINLVNLGVLAYYQADYEAAQSYFDQSLTIQRGLGGETLIASSLLNLGNVHRRLGDHEKAHQLYLDVLRIDRKLDNRHREATTLSVLGGNAVAMGEYDGARALIAESFSICQEYGLPERLACNLEETVQLCAALGQSRRVAALAGAAHALRERLGAPLPPGDSVEYERIIAEARAALDEDTFAAAWAEGESMSLDEVVAFALEIPAS